MKNEKQKLSGLNIALLVIGSPIWLSLLIAAFAVILSLYVVLWALVASLWAIMVALAGAGIGAVIGGIIFAVTGHAISGIATIGAGLCAAGLSIFVFFGCQAASVGTARLTGKIAYAIKKTLTREEVAE